MQCQWEAKRNKKSISVSVEWNLRRGSCTFDWPAETQLLLLPISDAHSIKAAAAAATTTRLNVVIADAPTRLLIDKNELYRNGQVES